MESKSKMRSILLVDDVELFLELERTFFHREGFDLLMAIEPDEIMQLIIRRQPDLVFIDMDSAGSRGDKICRWIKQDRDLRLIPVVMLVDSGDRLAESFCRQAGCDAIIQRPVRRQQLLSVAKTFLDLADRQQARIAARLPVEIGKCDREMKTRFSVNLSSGGLFVACEETLPVETSVSLRVDLPFGSKPLTCRGRVAWLNHSESGRKQPHLPAGMGIQFVPLAAEQLNVLNGYLTSSV